jgi:hypothetical protein
VFESPFFKRKIIHCNCSTNPTKAMLISLQIKKKKKLDKPHKDVLAPKMQNSHKIFLIPYFRELTKSLLSGFEIPKMPGDSFLLAS